MMVISRGDAVDHSCHIICHDRVGTIPGSLFGGHLATLGKYRVFTSHASAE